MTRRGVAEVRLGCGHLVLYRKPAPQPGDWIWCTRCDCGVQVAGKSRPASDRPIVTRLPRGRRRRIEDRRTRATDWAAGPHAEVVLGCGHTRFFRPPSPARGDHITCGTCGRSTLVLKPVRRTDRHGGPWSAADLDLRVSLTAIGPVGTVWVDGHRGVLGVSPDSDRAHDARVAGVPGTADRTARTAAAATEGASMPDLQHGHPAHREARTSS